MAARRTSQRRTKEKWKPFSNRRDFGSRRPRSNPEKAAEYDSERSQENQNVVSKPNLSTRIPVKHRKRQELDANTSRASIVNQKRPLKDRNGAAESGSPLCCALSPPAPSGTRTRHYKSSVSGTRTPPVPRLRWASRHRHLRRGR